VSVYFRATTEEDLPFIYSSWLQSYKKTVKYVSDKNYYKGQHAVIAALLEHSNSAVLCSQETDRIVGYIVWEGDTLHYIYVKNTFRGFGFGSSMVATCVPNVQYFTHYTPAMSRFLPGCEFDPYNLPWIKG
jgi:GNAT superfamily N-acetyltransferase